ncbi:ABC transporter permease [Maledivibacter halophilus]|uniref:NitT/TauT family transport system permease protein n=1 Tax=Maledivibacter halophilus TaxID=36842 RepID=A0A1T5MRI4_9FIRM|nr:ABC transporter permease subunit [Maledivibacter halophilus]SKC90792.1 NitT/TauT family transport system permease protein [Maledivibacter halophilus]
MRNKILHNKYILRFLWILVLAVIWQGIALSQVFNPASFPRIEKILYSLIHDAVKGDIIFQTLFSLGLIFKGLVFGLLIAIILSGLSMVSKVFEGFVETIIAVAHPLPGIALLPLVILWIGVGEGAIIFIIIHSVIWPLILNLLTGFRAIPKIYKEIGRNYELNTIGIIRYILVPAAFPHFITGLKIGWARAWRAVISAEMVFGAAGGAGGLGWFIFKKRVFMDTPGLFGGLIVIIFIGITIEDLFFDRLEKMTIRKWGMSI